MSVLDHVIVATAVLALLAWFALILWHGLTDPAPLSRRWRAFLDPIPTATDLAPAWRANLQPPRPSWHTAPPALDINIPRTMHIEITADTSRFHEAMQRVGCTVADVEEAARMMRQHLEPTPIYDQVRADRGAT